MDYLSVGAAPPPRLGVFPRSHWKTGWIYSSGTEIGVLTVFRITPLYNLGNQMLQYIVASCFARRVPGVEIVGYDMPLWGLSRSVPVDFPASAPRLRGHLFDFELAQRFATAGRLPYAHLRGLGFRMSNLGPPALSRTLFSVSGTGAVGFDERHLVVNVRGAEILANTHVDYGPIPVDFYRRLIVKTGLRPVFLGQIGDDFYTEVLKRSFPGATFVPSGGVLRDFESIRRSKNIVVSVSTFSWLAAWLSDAVTIHLPVFGLLNPAQRPDIDLLPVDDLRYRFYALPVRRWRASQPDIDALLTDISLVPLGLDDVRKALQQANWRTLLSRTLESAQFRMQVHALQRNRRPSVRVESETSNTRY